MFLTMGQQILGCLPHSATPVELHHQFLFLFVIADPYPLEQMYTCKGKDKYGLPLYNCHRGTSAEEGMHGHHNKLYKGGNYGRKLAQVHIVLFPRMLIAACVTAASFARVAVLEYESDGTCDVLYMSVQTLLKSCIWCSLNLSCCVYSAWRRAGTSGGTSTPYSAPHPTAAHMAPTAPGCLSASTRKQLLSNTQVHPAHYGKVCSCCHVMRVKLCRPGAWMH